MCFRVTTKGKMRLLLLLLLVQAFHLASLQHTTDSPGRTIDKSWLRARGKIPQGSENATFTEGNDEGADVTESNNDYSGTASGSMVTYSGEEENSENEKWEDQNVTTTTLSPGVQNGTIELTELPPTTNASQINMTETEGEFNKTLTPRNSTSFPDYSNRTDLESTTSVPETNTTEEHTTTNTTTLTTKAVPGINATTTTSSPTTVFLTDVPETTTAAAPNTPEKVNKTDKSAGLAGSSDTGTGAVCVTGSGPHLCV